MSHEKNPGVPYFPLTPGCSIGIILVSYNPQIIGQYNSLYTLNNQGLFHCSSGLPGLHLSKPWSAEVDTLAVPEESNLPKQFYEARSYRSTGCHRMHGMIVRIFTHMNGGFLNGKMSVNTLDQSHGSVMGSDFYSYVMPCDFCQARDFCLWKRQPLKSLPRRAQKLCFTKRHGHYKMRCRWHCLKNKRAKNCKKTTNKAFLQK